MGGFITEDAEDTEGTEEIEGRRVSLIAGARVNRNAGTSSVSSASSVMKTRPQQGTRRYSLRGKRKLAGSRTIRRRIAP